MLPAGNWGVSNRHTGGVLNRRSHLTTEYDRRPIELRSEGPHETQFIGLDHRQAGESIWKHIGSIEWPMERFELVLSWRGQKLNVVIYGPYLVMLAWAHLGSEGK